jgi:anti-sigma regulatory factor (Ser/Thr protein kinase)
MGDTHTATGARTADTIEIVVPLRAEHAATLRVIVASLGSDNGLTVDEIDDVKLAVSEVFTLLVDDADDVGATHAHVGYTTVDGTITITLHRGLDDDQLELDALAATILSSVVDRHVVGSEGVTIVKHAAEASG